MSRFAIVADDLTGASDTGIKLTMKGYETDVVFHAKNIDHMIETRKILAINTSSREDDPNVAYKKVYELIKMLKSYGINRIYKKVDSIFRGNIGVEIEASMVALNLSTTFLIPAIPSNGRTIIDGYLHIKNNANNKIDIYKLLEDASNLKVEKITLEDMQKGKSYVLKQIYRYAKKENIVILFDTEKNEDFQSITEIIKEYSDEFLLAGASGMANLLPEVWGIDTNKKKSHFIIAGSFQQTTSEQIKYLLDNLDCEIITLNTRKIISDNNKLDCVLDKVNSIISDQNRSGIIVIAVDTLLNSEIHPNKENGPMITDFISKVAKNIINSGCCEAITITGGETAFYVMQSLGVKGMQLKHEILSGIPVGIVIGGAADGLPLVTKSGGFGDKEAFIKVIKYFNKNREDVFLTNEI